MKEYIVISWLVVVILIIVISAFVGLFKKPSGIPKYKNPPPPPKQNNKNVDFIHEIHQEIRNRLDRLETLISTSKYKDKISGLKGAYYELQDLDECIKTKKLFKNIIKATDNE